MATEVSGTLTPNTVASVTIDLPADVQVPYTNYFGDTAYKVIHNRGAAIRVVNLDGKAPIWFTVDGTNPVIGSHGQAVAAETGSFNYIRKYVEDSAVVKLISASNTQYTVEFFSGDATEVNNTGGGGTPCPEPSYSAEGGNSEYDDGGYHYHVFTSSGTLTFVDGDNSPALEVLLVGGGGAGGRDAGGGGGAGGIAVVSIMPAYEDLEITIGAGGVAGSSVGPSGGFTTLTGEDTGTIGAPGGGGGGSWRGALGLVGGSGGGAGAGVVQSGKQGISGFGNDGGACTQLGGAIGCGGGGGFLTAGADCGPLIGGNGGDGTTIWGFPVGGGGGGGSANGWANTSGGVGGGGRGQGVSGAAVAGTANTGGGGGGGHGGDGGSAVGASGGSGLLVIRYLI